MFPLVEGEGGLVFSHKWPTLKQWQLHWNLIICSYLTGHPGNASEELMGNKQMRATRSPPAKPRVELQWSVDSSQRDLSSGKLSSQRTLQSGQASAGRAWRGTGTGQTVCSQNFIIITIMLPSIHLQWLTRKYLFDQEKEIPRETMVDGQHFLGLSHSLSNIFFVNYYFLLNPWKCTLI